MVSGAIIIIIINIIIISIKPLNRNRMALENEHCKCYYITI